MADEVKIKIGIDATKVKPALQQAGNQAKSSLNGISTASSKATTNLNNVAKAADGIGKAATGANGFLNVLKGIGPYGAIAAAGIGLVISAYQKLKQKAEEYKNAVLDLDKKSGAAGIDASAYLQLGYAARHSGIELENVLKVMKSISDVIDKAKSGNQKYIDTFNQLGIAWRDLQKLSPDKQLEKINDAISQYGISNDQLEAVFGKEAAQTLREMQSGQFNVRRAAAEAYGLSGPEKEELERLKAIDAVKKDREELKRLRKTFGIDYMLGDSNSPLNGNNDVSGYENPNKQFKRLLEEGKLSENDIKSALKTMFPNHTQKALDSIFNDIINWDVASQNELLSESYRKLITELQAKLVSKVNPNVNPNDPSTWMQPAPGREQTPEEKAQAQAQNEADAILSNIQTQIDAYADKKQALDTVAQAEAKIIEIEKKYNKTLDEQIKKEIRLKALRLREVILKNENQNNINKGNATLANAVAGYASRGSGMSPQFFLDYIKLIEKFSSNPIDLEKEIVNGTGYDSLFSLMTADPKKFSEAIKRLDLKKYHPKGNKEFDEAFAALENRGAKELLGSMIQTNVKLDDYVSKLKYEISEVENANNYIEDYDTLEGQEYLNRRKKDILRKFNIAPTKSNLAAYDKTLNEIIKDEDKLRNTKPKASMEAQSLSLEHDTELEHLKALQAEADDNEQRRLQTQIDEHEKINLLLKEGHNLAEAKARAAKGEADELHRQRKEYEKEKNLRSIAEDTNKTRWDNIVNDYVANRDFGQGYEEALIKQRLVNNGIPESQWKDYEPALRKQRAEELKGNAIRLKNSYTGVAESNYSDILRLIGRSKQANRYDALVSAKNELGTSLTKEQTNWVNKMSDLQYEIKNFKMPEQKDASIVTNDLASRGGFSESVRVSYHDNSDKILQACRELVNLSRRNNELQKEKEAVF